MSTRMSAWRACPMWLSVLTILLLASATSGATASYQTATAHHEAGALRPIIDPINQVRGADQTTVLASKKHKGHASHKSNDGGESLVADCERRGRAMLHLLEEDSVAKDNETAFTKYEQIEHNGWREKAVGVDGASELAGEFYSVKNALVALKLPTTQDPSWRGIQWNHSSSTREKKHQYLATNTLYVNIFNPSHGAIVVAKAASPSDSKPKLPADQQVPLIQWSDVSFLTWQHLAKDTEELQAIKYIFQVNVTNTDTEAAIRAFAPKSDLSRMPRWPGMNVDPNTVQGRVLVGSSDGLEVASFLAQHKETLGATRNITKITVWETSESEWEKKQFGSVLCMLFTISREPNKKHDL